MTTEKKLISINQNISISLDGFNDEWYDSKIQGVSAKEFQISMPYKKTSPLPLKKGDRVRLHITVSSAKYQGRSVVTGRQLDNIPLFTLTKPESFERIQLRQFVRLPIMMDILYSEKPENDKKLEFVKTYTLDISGGGVRFLAKQNIKPDSFLLLKMSVPHGCNVQELEAEAKVARSISAHGSGYQVSVEFVNITRKQQDMIVGFVLHETTKKT